MLSRSNAVVHLLSAIYAWSSEIIMKSGPNGKFLEEFRKCVTEFGLFGLTEGKCTKLRGMYERSREHQTAGGIGVRTES